MNAQAPDPKVVEHAKTVLEDLLRLMTFEAKVDVFALSEGEAVFHVESADAGRLIGRGAQVLDALQFTLNRPPERSHDSLRGRCRTVPRAPERARARGSV